MIKILNKQELIDARVRLISKDGVLECWYRPDTDIMQGGLWLHFRDGRYSFVPVDEVILNWSFA